MIELRNLTVRFGNQTVLHDFSADIPLSGTTAISGASGCGKTTLLRVLMGLRKPDAGTVGEMRGLRVSAVFQEDRLLPWMSALENVSLVSDEETAKRHLAALGLSEAMGERPAALSGGMKRRVAIARALAYGGDLLLLDEPFNGLDEAAKRVAAEAILAAGMAVVVVTHSAEEMELLRAERVLRL